ncbi:CIS tube protein [Dyadobacter sandarakinus]|uniref:Contractile injection system tube protein N-terminal domain-containing protein n=1 Tax=Dyadobacter sandarakinus TaxID=2747268 RepID=A0ABX7I3E8_9BACT|nr:hypothetical protein [Dyadobacter sandarakinus]QRR00611.1 hypothetical protein HWI92_06665 [Dyadobacter sandarakinus]
MEKAYVNKLRITSVRIDFSSPLAAASSIAQSLAGGIFELPINPEQYQRQFKIRYLNPSEIGGSKKKAEAQFSSVEPEVLDLKFTIDGTGIVPIPKQAIDAVSQAFAAMDGDAQVAFVTAKLAQLELVVYGIQDESHRPPFIILNWGKLVFVGTLLEMNQNYTLFHSSGLPLRVDVNLKIQQFILPAAAAAAMSLLSPDLTRQREVKASDTLLNLCTTIYEEPDYYLEVARINGLTNFRKLKPGSALLFPPVGD